VLAKDQQKVEGTLDNALAAIRVPWEVETLARNLRLIRQARERRKEPIQGAKVIEVELYKAGADDEERSLG